MNTDKDLALAASATIRVINNLATENAQLRQCVRRLSQPQPDRTVSYICAAFANAAIGFSAGYMVSLVAGGGAKWPQIFWTALALLAIWLVIAIGAAVPCAHICAINQGEDHADQG